MDAGRELFVARGYHDTRINDVVAAAGLSKGAFYRYFESKDRLVQVLGVQAIRTVSTALVDIPDGGAPTARPRTAAIRRWLRQLQRHAGRRGGDDPGLGRRRARRTPRSGPTRRPPSTGGGGGWRTSCDRGASATSTPRPSSPWRCSARSAPGSGRPPRSTPPPTSSSAASSGAEVRRSGRRDSTLAWRPGFRVARCGLTSRSHHRGGDGNVRTVVVGASSGLGRCIGIGLAQRGDQVALLARRRGRLDDAAKEAGPGTLVVECDVTDEASCRSAIAEAADGLGGIDALVYTPGIGPLAKLVDTDADTWRRVFDTNVTGAALVTAAAVPHLAESGGRRRLPVVGQRLADATLAGARLVRRQQGGPRQAGRGVAGRAPRHRLHPRDRRRLRRRRGRRHDRVQPTAGTIDLAAEVHPDLGRPQLPGRHAAWTSSASSPWCTQC